MATKVPGLFQRNNSFYYRIRVKAPLIEAFGKKEISEALGHLSYPQAAIKARELSAHYAALFQSLLHELGLEETAPISPAMPRRSPSMAEVTHIAREAARELLVKDELVRSSGVNSAGGDHWSSVLQDFDDEISVALSGGKQGQLYQRFEADLTAHGLTSPTDREEKRLMVYRWASIYGKSLQQVQQRVKGEPVDTPEPQDAPASLKETKGAAITDPSKKTAEQLKLRDIFQLWIDHEPNRPGKTVASASLAVGRFESMSGNPSIGALTRADGADYRKKLMGSELSQCTASTTLVWVNILLNFEVDNYQRIVVNPWKKLSITDNVPTIRDEWKDSQVIQLFSDPVFQAYSLPKSINAGLDAAYWVPVIGAYTGARASEIAQLVVDDLQVVDGIQCFRIAVTDKSFQSLKNEPSKRIIPIHPELIRLGLLDFAGDMKALGAARLFPALKVSDSNGAGGGVSNWFSKFKKLSGFGPENTFHGWRNTVESKLQRVREGQIYIDRYLGHKPEGMGAGTYARVQPADLVGTAAKIAYEGLNLPKVYREPSWKP